MIHLGTIFLKQFSNLQNKKYVWQLKLFLFYFIIRTKIRVFLNTYFSCFILFSLVFFLTVLRNNYTNM